MGLGGLVKSITKPISSAVQSIADIPGSVSNFVENPWESAGKGISNFYQIPGRALDSDTLRGLGGAGAAVTGGLLGGPNLGKASGAPTGMQQLGQQVGRGTLATIGTLGAMAGGSALFGSGAAGAGAGSGYGAGSGLSANGVGLGGSYGGSLGLNAGASGLGLNAGTLGTSSLGAGAGGSSFLGSLGSGLSSVGSFLTSTPGVMAGLGITDLIMRQRQQQQLEDIAREAANRSDAFQQQQRFPYQNLVNDFFQGNADITDQPYVQANMARALEQAQAQLARFGRTGSGGAGRELVDYSNEVFNSTALPYLQQLSGMAGFGFAPGNSGNLYGQYAAQASGAPFLGLQELARAFGLNQPTIQPWQRAAYNSQQQMMGLGEGRDWRLS